MVACCCAQLTFLMHFGLFRGFQFHSDLKVLLLSSYDMILGIDWLESHSPMKVHWGHKWVQIPYHGTTVKLFGTLTSLPAGSFFQLCDSNLPPGANSADTWLMEIQTLVAEFSSLFQPPTQLPPSRAYDHAIPLIAGAAPVYPRPYRFAPAVKDEIEKQVQEMLSTGLIQKSSSPFSSSILLLKTKDNSWRFCMDYCHPVLL